jgi:hypothetical protein
MNQSIEDAIIADATEAGLYIGTFGSVSAKDGIKSLRLFAKLQAARQSSQSEPVASESHLTKVLKLTALEHAIELSSKHGSGPVDLGCFTVLQDMAEEIRNGNLASPTAPIESDK